MWPSAPSGGGGVGGHEILTGIVIDNLFSCLLGIRVSSELPVSVLGLFRVVLSFTVLLLFTLSLRAYLFCKAISPFTVILADVGTGRKRFLCSVCRLDLEATTSLKGF